MIDDAFIKVGAGLLPAEQQKAGRGFAVTSRMRCSHLVGILNSPLRTSHLVRHPFFALFFAKCALVVEQIEDYTFQ